MQFYWSLKKIPELRQRIWKERRQAIWQVGLKPFRHWQVWVALVIASLEILWGMETLLGNLLWNPSTSSSDKGLAILAAGSFAIGCAAVFFYAHVYRKALRPYLDQVSFNRAGSWWAAMAKGALVDLVSIVLIFGGVFGIDWAINSYDESPDPRIAALKSWPEPIPASGNGTFAAIGMMAPAGTSPAEAGERNVAALNEAILKHSHDYPKPPAGLEYVAFAAKPQPGGKPNAYAVFCNAGMEPCWKVVREERGEVTAWLAANQELLARYRSLQQYPQWQFAIMPGDASTPIPSYQGMLRAQTLLQASAMLEIEKKQAGKGLEMIGGDIRFLRNALAGKDALVGKMVLAAMLSKDIALLAQTMQERPGDLKPYLAQIGQMLEPLSASQVSVADAYRFEERWIVSIMGREDTLAQMGADVPFAGLGGAWADRHYKKNATANLLLGFWDKVIQQTEVSDASHTPAISAVNPAALLDVSRVTGFMHNQEGKFIALAILPDYYDYPNRLFDLNALNNLVRLQATLAEKSVPVNDVPAFLNGSGKSLWNPETGKPFEWDAARKEIYFVPITESARKRNCIGCGVPGRVGVAVRP